MKCPTCESKMEVLSSAPHGETVRRRRRCTKCGTRRTTEERVIVLRAMTPEEQRQRADRALALAEERRKKQADARRTNEDRALARALGIDPEELDNG